MNFLNQLIEKRKYYYNILQYAKKLNNDNIDGRLAVYKSKNNKYKYYCVIYKEGKAIRKYINQSEMKLADKLAKKLTQNY